MRKDDSQLQGVRQERKREAVPGGHRRGTRALGPQVTASPGINRYIVTCIKQITNQDHCTAQGTVCNIL